ncbi:MAG: hydroxymethylglutaryl-CoA lyase, partial [Gammaproteobacteria bacterium]|nr:hydroxymethylglutaryl-CoA lyase [Gammaproteobacteria bacterium]
MKDLPKKVILHDVSPRDGLQSIKQELSIAQKIELINDLSDAGLPSIEIGAFVNKDAVPQLADTDEVFSALKDHPDCVYSALLANQQGMQRALQSGVKKVALLTAASETFCKKNTHCTIAESIQRIHALVPLAKQQGVLVRVYISCSFFCPYEGEINSDSVLAMVKQLWSLGIDEIALADTPGQATAWQVSRLVKQCLAHVPAEHIALHFHDTYGQALANIYASLQLGISTVDSSIAGLGGCPYAPGASGNVATEDLLYLLQGLDIESGVDMGKLIIAGEDICQALGRNTQS